MALSITKKVRLDPREAALLRRLARESHVTESDILRDGLHRLERVRSRQANVEAFIRFLGESPEPEAPGYRFQ
jgi:hypothetical protein